jgi:hypothetical protein
MGRVLAIACFALFILAAVFIQAALAQTCPDTNPEADPQTGCPQPFHATFTKPAMRQGAIEFNITVKNRKIVFPPSCNPGEQFCYDNFNFQGLALCEGWTGTFKEVKVELASCYPDCDLEGCPDCDFNVTVTPSGPQQIDSEGSRNFTVSIEAFRMGGEYDFTFRALLSSAKKKIFSLHMNITSQTLGVEGDNAQCTVCSSEKCDAQRTSCGYSCPGATFCTAPECLFDTPVQEASESCCGDDSGEVFKQCSKMDDVDWGCPFNSACCQGKEECVYSGKCYPEGVHLVASGEDEYSYCMAGFWRDCDESGDVCSNCGFSWNDTDSACCGDDSDEYFRSRICFSGCETNMTDKACCVLGSACVYDGKCYATRQNITLSGKNVTCEGGVWVLKANQTACYKGECKKNNKCEGACPGCIFKDYSCYGNNCEADYLDPDMHWTYCANCSLNWSVSQCCGDDEKEYWVPPCPNANASWGCCSNPNERVGKNGECVIYCGTTVRAGMSALEESLIPLAVSLNPDVVNVEAGGKNAEFSVLVSTGGNQSLHNVMLSLCGPFMFQSSPQVIEELRPGETGNFTVHIAAASDSQIGTMNFAAYVSSSELIRQRYKPGYANVTVPGYPSTDFYIVIAFGVAGAFALRKLRSRRKPAAKEKPEKAGKKKDSGRKKLVELVRAELDKGTPEGKLRKVLAANGIGKAEIDAAFREAKNKG